MKAQTLENITAIRVSVAVDAMTSAADALAELKTPEARQHATEIRGAATVAAGWVRELRRQHRDKQMQREHGGSVCRAPGGTGFDSPCAASSSQSSSDTEASR